MHGLTLVCSGGLKRRNVAIEEFGVCCSSCMVFCSFLCKRKKCYGDRMIFVVASLVLVVVRTEMRGWGKYSVDYGYI
jgi:hypothetical protein